MTKQISLVNRSGYTLRGIIDLPEGASEQNRFPVVVNVHGFTGNKSGFKNMHVQTARYLAAEGIASVRFDLYGNGESDGEFEDMRFTGCLNDIEDIFAWTKEQPWAKEDALVLAGQSMGGYLASCAAPKLKPDALVLMCPGGGMWYGALERAEMFESKGIFEADVGGLKFATAFNRDLHQYEPFSSAQGYHGPVLLLRGTKDELVNEEACGKYCEVYGDACTYVQVEDGDHNFSSVPAREILNKAILEFLKEKF